MKKSENKLNGSCRSPKAKANAAAAAPDVRMRRQEAPLLAPAAPPALERHMLNLDLSGEAWAALQRMAQIEETDVEYAIRRALGQSAATMIEGGSSGDPEEPIVAMFLDRATPPARPTDEESAGRHVVSIELNDYAMAALRFYAVDYRFDTVEAAARDCVRCNTSTITQITEDDFNERFAK